MKIKSIILLLVPPVLFCNTLFGQCWNDVQTVSTRWDHPLSTNTWNWTANAPQTMYIKTGTTISPIYVDLPYFCNAPGVGTAQCSNPNITHFQRTTYTDLDIFPEDGWELLVKNFGCENIDPAKCRPEEGVEYPYFVLYNKVNGKLKTFFLIPFQENENGASISYLINNYRTAVLSQGRTVTKSLQEFDPTITISTPSFYDRQDYWWIYSEMQTYYDPCGCLDPRDPPVFNVPSELEIILKLRLDQDIKLVGEGTLVQDIITQSPGATSVNGREQTSLVPGLLNAYDAGQKAYKSWAGFVGDIRTYFDKQSSEYKNGVFSNFWEHHHPAMNNASIPQSVKEQFMYDYFTANPNAMEEFMGLKLEGQQIKDNKKLLNIASKIPYIGPIISIIDFFSAGGQEKQQPVSPEPMMFNVKLKFEGSLSTSKNAQRVKMAMPGSRNTGSNPPDISDSYIPHYNNTLGVLGILKSPRLGYQEYLPEQTGTYKYVNPPNEVTGSLIVPVPANSPKIKQFKLVEDLKYMINPHANVEVMSVDAAIILEYTNGQMQDHFYFNANCNNLSDYYPTCWTPGKGTFNWVPVLIGDPKDVAGLTVYEKVERSGFELDYLAPNFLPVNPGDQKTMRIRTPYVPIECLNNVSFYLFQRQWPAR